jgi:hypothetical protein
MAGIRDAVEVDNDILIINDWDRKYTSIYIYIYIFSIPKRINLF